MPLLEPRKTLGFLIALYLNAALFTIPIFELLMPAEWPITGPALLGAALTQLSLGGFWAVRGGEALLARWPRAIFLLTLSALFILLGARIADDQMVIDPSIDPQVIGFVFTFVVGMFAACVGVESVGLRLTNRRLVVATAPSQKVEMRPTQFSLKHLVIWTAGVAVLLGFSRLLPSYLWVDRNYLHSVGWQGLVAGAVVAGVLFLPLQLATMPISSIMLRNRPCSGRRILAAAMVSLLISAGEILILGAIGFVLAPSWADFVLAARTEGLDISACILSFNGGIFIAATCALLLVRNCGYRLATTID